MAETASLPDMEIYREEVSSLDPNEPYIVILYNCSCHDFDQVIKQLQKATGCNLETAEAIAWEAHLLGRAVAYGGEEDACERVAAILRSIRLQVEVDRSG